MGGVVKLVYKHVCCKLKSPVLNLVNLSPAATTAIKLERLPSSLKVAQGPPPASTAQNIYTVFKSNNDNSGRAPVPKVTKSL